MSQIRRRLSYANVMSSLAVFLVLGGGAAFAATHLPGRSVGTRQLKRNAVKTGKIAPEAVKAGKLAKNAVPTNRIRDNAVTGAKVDESTLSTVPSAETANNLDGFKTFSGSGSEGTMTTLLSTGQFDVVGICDQKGEYEPPGFPNEYLGSSLGIVNHGQNGGVADTYDDDNLEFNIGDGVAFDYLDGGDPGTAVLPNGHWIHVLGGTITESETNPNFGSGCTFHGLAFSG